MRSTDVVIIGGGQAGLAMSRCLLDRNIDHVVLERGRVAESWRSARWDSLRLLTPRWQSRLPGWSYRGLDPDGFMTMPEVTAYLERYARSFAAPVEAHTSVEAVEADASGYHVATDRGSYHASAVVVATGATGTPYVPPMARELPPHIHQEVPTRYRRPAQLPDGGVLVVGASASGLQLAEEIHASGRPVTLSVGRHARLPRRYRGRDIMWWLDAIGALDERADEVRDAAAARAQPSLQLVGRPDHRSLDLAALAARGVRLVGRTAAIDAGRAHFADDLQRTAAQADAKLERLLDRIDPFADRHGAPPARRPAPLLISPSAPALDLRAIRTVVWATGSCESYPWLRVPVLDDRGCMRHRGGVTAAPGLYVLGLRMLRTRKSTFIDGVGDDAQAIARHLAAELRGPESAAA
jgi:putative flavoprotein involved in K+ transport